MKSDPRLTKLARLLVEYSVEVKEGDKVVISGTTASEPLLREIYREVLQAGGHPTVRMQFEDEDYIFYSLGKDFQIDYTDAFALHEMENADASIGIVPDLNPHALTSVDPEKKRRRVLSRKPIFETIFRREEEGTLRWVGTVCPSPALAQEAKMAFEEYAEFVFSCMHLNEENPIDFWRRFSAEQQKICDRLNGVKEMRYVGQDTDLRFRCEGRTWINCDGKNNFPDGEVFTGPVEDSVEGTIRFTFPGVFQGEEVEDIFLRFEKGRVVESRAAKGERLLHKLLDTDEGAKVVGEIAVGTNAQIDRFTKNMLFDEKMGGTVHLAMGRGYPESGSKNVSAVHWDMLKNMRDDGKIFADGKLIYENGSFLEF
ncbi:MAG: aminopeptidase [bacterium]